MNSKHLLAALFACILLSLAAMTLWASTQQPVWHWQGLTSGADRWWTRATLMDAYYGFVTFFVWVCFKERGAASRTLWFIAIMALGNMAMAGYVLLQLMRLTPGEPASAILTSQRPG
jgi:archaellum biogenesis protein FlaJ (TadC family)